MLSGLSYILQEKVCNMFHAGRDYPKVCEKNILDKMNKNYLQTE